MTDDPLYPADLAQALLARWPAEAARTRAIYRRGLAAPDCLALVILQDGNEQFVHQQDGQVVFWEQRAV